MNTTEKMRSDIDAGLFKEVTTTQVADNYKVSTQTASKSLKELCRTGHLDFDKNSKKWLVFGRYTPRTEDR